MNGWTMLAEALMSIGTKTGVPAENADTSAQVMPENSGEAFSDVLGQSEGAMMGEAEIAALTTPEVDVAAFFGDAPELTQPLPGEVELVLEPVSPTIEVSPQVAEATTDEPLAVVPSKAVVDVEAPVLASIDEPTEIGIVAPIVALAKEPEAEPTATPPAVRLTPTERATTQTHPVLPNPELEATPQAVQATATNTAAEIEQQVPTSAPIVPAAVGMSVAPRQTEKTIAPRAAGVADVVPTTPPNTSASVTVPAPAVAPIEMPEGTNPALPAIEGDAALIDIDPKVKAAAPDPELPRQTLVQPSPTRTAPIAAPALDTAPSPVAMLSESTDISPLDGMPLETAPQRQASLQTNQPLTISRAPEFARAVTNQLVAQVRTDPAGPYEIRLDPPELGRIAVRMVATEAGMVAQISADRGDVLDTLRKSESQIARDFADAGFEGLAFSFTEGSDADSASDDGSENSAPDVAPDFLAASTDAAPTTARPMLINGRLDVRL